MPKCRICKCEFDRIRPLQPVCASFDCRVAYGVIQAEKSRQKREKSERKPKKAKRPSLPSLKRKADEITSLYIRQKFADLNGNISCVSCGKVMPWKESHCAHYIKRGKYATRWMEENLHPACPHCNAFNKEWHQQKYTLAMIDLHGRKFVDELHELEKKVLTGTQVRALAEEAIQNFGKQLEELQCKTAQGASINPDYGACGTAY